MSGRDAPKGPPPPATGAVPAEAAGRHPLSFLLTPNVLVNRLILSEVLGPPRSQRRGR